MGKPIIIGRFGRTFGIHGYIRVQSYTRYKTDITAYQPWLVKIEDSWQPLEILNSQEHSGELLVKMTGFDTPEVAQQCLTGKEIALARENLPQLKAEEYYWADLEGLTVINQDGINFGKVEYLIETGSNDVLVVKGDRERLIPYDRDQVIIKVDLAHQQILVQWDQDF